MIAAAYSPMIALVPLFLVVMLLVAGLVAGVALLSNERTRVTGGVILGILVALVLGGGALVMLARFASRVEVQHQAQWNAASQPHTETTINVFSICVLAAGLAAGIAMLFSQRTRVAGGLVLGLVPVLAVGGGLLSWLMLAPRVEVQHQAQSSAESRVRSEDVEIALQNVPGWPRPLIADHTAPPVMHAAPAPAEKEEPVAAEAETAPRADDTKSPDKAVAANAEPSKSPARPEWLERKPVTSGDTYAMVAVVGPYTSRLECDTHLVSTAQHAVDEFVAAYFGREFSGRVLLSDDFILTQLIKAQWEEPVQASFGPMVQVHVLLEFDHKVKEHLRAERNQLIVTRRLGVIGTGVAAALLVLCIAFIALKIDLVSGGQRRGRLAVGAALALIAVVGAATFLIEGFCRPLTAPPAASLAQPLGAAHSAPPLSPAEALAHHSATWANLLGLMAVVVVGLVVVGAGLVASGRHRGKLLMLLGAALLAVLVAVMALDWRPWDYVT